MIVISDTGPLNYLALIGHLDALPTLYKQVVVPPAVVSELSRHPSPDSIKNLFVSMPSWLRIGQVSLPDPDLSDLGDGEQQAITLARSLRADLLLCDDKDAREVAQRSALRVIGTLGVLKEAAHRGLLNFSEALEKLQATNFRISRALINRISQEDAQS